MDRGSWLGVALVSVAGCFTPLDSQVIAHISGEGAMPAYFVPGSYVPVWIVDECVSTGTYHDPVYGVPLHGLNPDEYCTNDVAVSKILSVTIDNPSVASVDSVDGNHSIWLHVDALGHSAVRISVVKNNGDHQDLVVEVSSSYGNQVAMSERCRDPSTGHGSVVPADSDVEFAFSVTQNDSGTLRPIYGANYVPLDGGPLTFVGGAMGVNGTLTVHTPPQPMPLSITSPIDPRLNLLFGSMNLGSVTGLSADTAGAPFGGAYRFLVYADTAYGRLCNDILGRTITSRTPSTCGFGATFPVMINSTGPEFFIAGTAGARCQIHVALDGTAVTYDADFVM